MKLMNIFYPPDYKYGLIYLVVIILIVIVAMVLSKKYNTTDQSKSSHETLVKVLLGFIMLLTLYFFALPAYL